MVDPAVQPHVASATAAPGRTADATVAALRSRLATVAVHHLGSAVDEALEAVGEALDAARVFVFVLDGATWTNRYEWLAEGTPSRIDAQQAIPSEWLPAWLPLLRAGDPVVVPDAATLDGERAEEGRLITQLGVRAVLAQPMLSFGELIGLVGVSTPHPRGFDDQSLRMLGDVADMLATAWVRREARSSVGRAQARLEELLRHVDDVLVILDPSGACTWSSTSVSVLGLEPRQLLGVRVRGLLVDEDAAQVRRLVLAWRAGDPTQPLPLPEMQLVTPLGIRRVTGQLRDLRHVPGVEGDLLTLHDVTERRHTIDTSLRNAATDPLTRLPNRNALRVHLAAEVAAGEARGATLGVLHLGLDNFKLVNDARGQSIGDDLLRQAASRLTQLARDHESVARVGGDEFVVSLREERPADVRDAAERFTRAVASPYFIDGQVEEVTASAGLRLHAAHRQGGVDELLRDADTALFVAKERGRDRTVVFDPTMAAVAARRSHVTARLRDAVDHGLVAPAFQPIVALRTGEVVGAEALARWQDAQLGHVAPDEFIPIAEQTGLVRQLGLQMLQRSAETFASWPESLHVSVNVSARQLEDPDLAGQIGTLLRAAGLPAARMQLEVTESMLMRDEARARRVLHELRELGLTIALDDFGTGHSSLAVLRDLPLDVLKIDRAFVGTLHSDERNRAVVTTIVAMATHFGLQTVAEGVELPEHAEMLLEAGCDFSQGWLHGRPVPPQQFAADHGLDPAHLLADDLPRRPRTQPSAVSAG